MTETAVLLEDLERDASTELVNIGVSRAAASLRKMVGRQVLLSVPAIEIVTRSAAATLLRERETGQLVAVRQDFEGAFAGRALLIFPEGNSHSLVRAVAGDMPDDEAAAFEEEALAETGNIVLNGCLASMANMLQRRLTLSLPQVLRGDGHALFDLSSTPTDDGIVIFLYINFTVNERNIRGYIAMLMDFPSLTALKILVNDFIQRIIGLDGDQFC